MKLNTDGIRATTGLLATQTLNALVLLNVVGLDTEQLAAINALAGTVVTMIFFFVKAS